MQSCSRIAYSIAKKTGAVLIDRVNYIQGQLFDDPQCRNDPIFLLRMTGMRIIKGYSSSSLSGTPNVKPKEKGPTTTASGLHNVPNSKLCNLSFTQ